MTAWALRKTSWQNIIKAQLEETTSEFDKEKLQERLAKLAGGVAVIRVGAATETEMKEAPYGGCPSESRAAVEEGNHLRWWFSIHPRYQRRLQSL